MISETYKVLLVEDDAGHASLIQRGLANAGVPFDVEWVTCLADAATKLQATAVDVLLLDLTLPDGAGHDAVSAIRTFQPDLPIVVLTALASDEMASTLLEQGVQDYLVKDCLTSADRGSHALLHAIRYATRRQKAAQEIQRLYARSQHQQKLLSQKNRHLGRLYSVAQTVVENVSHDFRTPLTVIKEYVSLINDDVVGEINAEQRRLLNIIADRADDLNRMVDDMLDVSKLDAGMLTVRRTRASVSDIIQAVVDNLAHKAASKRVHLTIDIDEHLPAVYCDSDKAARTAVNLAVNAIKFCRESGNVCLSAHFDLLAQEVVVRVADDGPGIQSKDLQKIFHRFTQVDLNLNGNSQGFGLGLSIAREMVELNLGRITVTSQPNVGSCFSFTLPVADPSVLTRRFVERSQANDDILNLSMCLFATDTADTDRLDDFESFLYYVLRGDNLVLRLQQNRWMVLLPGDADTVAKLRRRATKMLSEANYNRVGALHPPFTVSLVAQWAAPVDVESVLCQLASLQTAKEAIHDHCSSVD